jgi:hypothetical protein
MLTNETLPDAVGAQVERGVGRLVPKRATVGMRGAVSRPKGNYRRGYVSAVDLSGLHVLWIHNDYRMTDRWYPVADVIFEKEDA